MSIGEIGANVFYGVAASAVTGLLLLAVKNLDVGVLLSIFDRAAYFLLGTRYGHSTGRWKAFGHRWKLVGTGLFTLLASSLLLLLLSIFIPRFCMSAPIGFIVYIAIQAAVITFLLFYQARWFNNTLGGLQGWIGEKAQMREYEYEEYRVIYFVSTRRRDSWSRKIVIHAKEDMVGIKTIDIGLSEESFHAHRSPASMKLKAETNPGKGRVLLFPFLQGLSWKISTLFTAPILPSETRSLIVGGYCKNTWQPLRETGEDSGYFDLAKTAKVLEIVIVLPEQYVQAQLVRDGLRQITQNKNSTTTRRKTGSRIGQVREELDQEGRRQLIWRIIDAEPGRYMYSVMACFQKQ